MLSHTGNQTAGAEDALPRVPVRTCVGCRQPAEQRALVRLTRNTAGQITIDAGRRRQPGRGAYLCRTSACWEAALRRGGLARALRGPVAPEDRATLLAHAAQFRTAEFRAAPAAAPVETLARTAPERPEPRKVDTHDEPR